MRLKLFSVLALIACSTTSAGAAPDPMSRVGGELLASLGLNACSEDGDAKCDDMGSSVELFVAPGYRFNPYAGVYLDVGFGMLSPDDKKSNADSANILWVMPTLRGIYPLDSADLHVGLGIGYTRSSVSGEANLGAGKVDYSSTRTNMTDLKLSIGGAYYLTEAMAVGADLGLLFLANGTGEVCSEIDGKEKCSDIDSGEAADLLQIGAFLRYRL